VNNGPVRRTPSSGNKYVVSLRARDPRNGSGWRGRCFVGSRNSPQRKRRIAPPGTPKNYEFVSAAEFVSAVLVESYYRGRLRGLEFVAKPTMGLDAKAVGEIRTDLHAKPLDIDVYGFCRPNEVFTPG
jgi:hypothetical protein